MTHDEVVEALKQERGRKKYTSLEELMAERWKDAGPFPATEKQAGDDDAQEESSVSKYLFEDDGATVKSAEEKEAERIAGEMPGCTFEKYLEALKASPLAAWVETYTKTAHAIWRLLSEDLPVEEPCWPPAVIELAKAAAKAGHTLADFKQALAENVDWKQWAEENKYEVESCLELAVSALEIKPRKPQTPSWVAALNQEHAVAMVGGDPVIVWFNANGVIDFGSEAGLHRWYTNERRTLNKRNVPLSEAWLRHPLRRQYRRGVVFAPGEEVEGALNLYRGFTVVPSLTGSWHRFNDHLFENICKDNDANHNNLLDWTAHMYQHPEVKPGVGAIFSGLQGVGKDFVGVHLGKPIENNYVTVSQESQLTGRFNSHFERALLLHVQEGSWAGDRKAENNLKSLITSETIAIERKGVDLFQVKSCMRLLITSNADWIVPASFDARRFFVLEVGDAHRNDHAYFAKIEAELKAGGYGRMLHDLLHRDLSNYDPRQAPMTDGLRNQKLASMRGVERWWHGVIFSRERPLDHDFNDPVDWETHSWQIKRTALHASCARAIRERKWGDDPPDEETFGKKLRKLLPSLGDTRPRMAGKPTRTYVIPPLPECRKAFENAIGHTCEW